jgi:putative membrane protein
MWLDAILAYLHYIAIFLLFSTLFTELVMMKGSLDAAVVNRLGRVDIFYFIAAIAVLVTGFLRATLGAKGPDFYFNSWPIYAKLVLFLAVGVISIKPTLTFIQWKRMFEKDASWRVAEDEQARIRRLVSIEVHLAAVIPVFAVIMSRGLGH